MLVPLKPLGDIGQEVLILGTLHIMILRDIIENESRDICDQVSIGVVDSAGTQAG